MSTTIDNRVVEMQFDNRNFERNVQTSMSTLEKLKQSLNLTGAAKGLTEIDSASKKMNFAGLGSAVDSVQAKFSALQIMGVTALANITNSAVNAGKRIVSALTIAPIRTGFQEYETQINAVQTILANTESKGTTLQDVNRALDELNLYADKTIYNFTQMTKNIGTFTAAGVDLDTSVKAIQGIANLAAVSGSTSQQASTAMYQLSQALAAGRVNLMDWNSVVNAGMGGQVFQEALKRTAKNMGKDVDGIIAKYGSFRESLSRGEWLTTDVLTKTLEQFTMAAEKGTEKWEMYKQSLVDEGYTEKQAEEILKMANTATDAATKVKTFTQLWDTLKESAQSGWTQTWEIIIGDFGEAKEFLTQISDTIGGMLQGSADARNKLLSTGLSSGWKQLLGGGGLENAGIADEAGYIDTLKTVAKEHGVSIDDMIKKEQELDASLTDNEAFQKVLKQGLKDGSITSDMFSESVSKLAEKMGKMSAKELEAAGYTADHVDQIKNLDKALKEGKISMEEFVNKMMRPSGRENLIESLWNVCKGIMSVIKPIKSAFDEIFPAMEGEQLYKFTEKLKEFTSKLTLSSESADKLKTAFKGIFSIIRTVINGIKTLAGGAVELLGNFKGIGGTILDAAESFGIWLSNLSESVDKTDIFAKAVEKITTFVSNAITKIKEFGGSVKEAFHAPTFEGLLGFFQGIWQIVKAVGSGVAKIFEPLGKILSMSLDGANIFDLLNSGLLAGGAAALGRFAFIFESFYGKVAGGYGILDYLKDAFDEVGDSLYAWQTTLKAETLIKIGTAIGIIAASILVLSSIDSEGLDRAVGAITILFAELIGAYALFSKINTTGNPIAKLMDAFKRSAEADVLIKMAVAIGILSGSLWVLSKIDAEAMDRSLGAMTAALAELLLAVTGLSFLDNGGGIEKAAKSMVVISIAMIIMSKAVESFSEMSWDKLIRGLTGMGIALGVVVAAMNLIPNNWSGKMKAIYDDKKGIASAKSKANLISAGIAMIAMAGAMKIMASAVKDFAKMNWDEIGRGLAGFAGAIFSVALAMKLMPTNSFGVGAGLLVAAAAMTVMVKVLQDFIKMGPDSVETALGGLAVLLLELVLALQAMTGTLPGSAALIVAAGALAILAPVLKTLGSMKGGEIAKGIIALAAAFGVIGVAGYLLAPLVPMITSLAGACALFGLAALAVGVGVLALAAGLGMLATAGAAGATALVAAIGVIITGVLDLIPTIISKVGEVILAICKVLKECAPDIAETILVVISEVLVALATYTPQIVDSLFTFVIGILDTLAARMPELIQSAVNLIGAFFRGIVDALKGIDTTNLIQGIVGVGLLTGLMFALSAVAGLIPGAMLGVLGMGLVIAELALVLAAIGGLAQIPGLSWLIEEGGNFLQTIGTAIGQFVGGIVGGIAEGATSTLPQVGSNLSEFMTNAQPFFDGVKNIDASVLNSVKAIAGAVLALTGANLIESLTSWLTGGSSLVDFGADLAAFGPYMAEYAKAVDGIDAASIVASAIAAKALVQVADAIPNEGGVVSWFTGDNTLGDFAEQLVPFGEGLKDYSDAVSGINSDAISKSVVGAKALVEIADAIPNEGGVVSWFTGDNDLGGFAEQLVPFGEGLKDYSDSVIGLNSAAIAASSVATTVLIGMVNNISSADTSGVSQFVSAISTLGRISIDALVKAFDGASVKLATVGADIFESIVKGMEANRVTLELAVEPAVNSLMECFVSKKDDFDGAGENLMTQFITAVKREGAKTGSALTSPLTTSVAKVRTYYTSFYNAGAHISGGLAAGMRSKLQQVRNAADDIADEAAKAARAALLVESPSRVFYAIGEFVVQGFTNALGDGGRSVYSTAKDMADHAKTGFNNAVSKINSVFSDGIDSQPTIRPVLDLSDVTAGANKINGMFGMTPSVGVASNINSISSMMNHKNQNGANNDIISELGKLRNALGNIGGNTYNINGITYDDGSAVSEAVSTLARHILIEGRA